MDKSTKNPGWPKTPECQKVGVNFEHFVVWERTDGSLMISKKRAHGPCSDLTIHQSKSVRSIEGVRDIIIK